MASRTRVAETVALRYSLSNDCASFSHSFNSFFHFFGDGASSVSAYTDEEGDVEWYPADWAELDEQVFDEWFMEQAPDPDAEAEESGEEAEASPDVAGAVGAMEDMTLSDDQASYHTAWTGDSWDKPPLSQDGSDGWRHVRAEVGKPPQDEEDREGGQGAPARSQFFGYSG